ncbi:hypothetical protein ALC53_01535 [Atta colombica]|uniref:Uncharacterized protein n=1 Tax=Atta colombica TaxID=520822 RepID=A0A195BUP3_9HYME|nr:hypothetical protein ALC53_01535 [Atta colombica]
MWDRSIDVTISQKQGSNGEYINVNPNHAFPVSPWSRNVRGMISSGWVPPPPLVALRCNMKIGRVYPRAELIMEKPVRRGRHVQHCELCILHTAARDAKRTRADRLAYVRVLTELGHSRSIMTLTLGFKQIYQLCLH